MKKFWKPVMLAVIGGFVYAGVPLPALAIIGVMTGIELVIALKSL